MQVEREGVLGSRPAREPPKARQDKGRSRGQRAGPRARVWLSPRGSPSRSACRQLLPGPWKLLDTTVSPPSLRSVLARVCARAIPLHGQHSFPDASASPSASVGSKPRTARAARQDGAAPPLLLPRGGPGWRGPPAAPRPGSTTLLPRLALPGRVLGRQQPQPGRAAGTFEGEPAPLWQRLVQEPAP